MSTAGWVLLVVAGLAWFDLMFLLVLGMHIERLKQRLDYLQLTDHTLCAVCMEQEGDL